MATPLCTENESVFGCQYLVNVWLDDDVHSCWFIAREDALRAAKSMSRVVQQAFVYQYTSGNMKRLALFVRGEEKPLDRGVERA